MERWSAERDRTRSFWQDGRIFKRPSEDLEPIHQRLIEAYEQALPAYDEIIEVAESGDPQRMSAAVSEKLPRIERFNEMVALYAPGRKKQHETS